MISQARVLSTAILILWCAPGLSRGADSNPGKPAPRAWKPAHCCLDWIYCGKPMPCVCLPLKPAGTCYDRKPMPKWGLCFAKSCEGYCPKPMPKCIPAPACPLPCPYVGR